MSAEEKDLSIGLEEELFLVDKKTTELCSQWPEGLWASLSKRYPKQIMREFLSGQVELISSPASSITALYKEMHQLRTCLVKQTLRYGLSPMASSTHPSALWRNQLPTPSDRYQRLAKELQVIGERMLVCGTHIHIGINDPKRRLRLYNELSYFLPLILSLTTSSPFWAGKDSGLMSYRTAVIKGLPRAGLPPVFSSLTEYQNYLSHMTQSGAIKTGKELWWDLRLSATFPTVELRIGDTCTHLEDLMAVAALVQSLSRYLLQSAPLTKSELDLRLLYTKENRWRSQRYTMQEGRFLVVNQKELQPINAVMKRLINTLIPHAKILGCHAHLMHCFTILKQGTSADKQKQIYRKHKAEGDDNKTSIDAVSNYLINQTAMHLNKSNEFAIEEIRKETCSES